MRTTWGRRRYKISEMVLDPMETVSFNGRLRFESWVDIQGSGRVGLVVLKVNSKDLDRDINLNQRVFFCMRHDCFVCSDIIDKILLKVFQLKKHCFGFIGDRCNEKWKGLSDVGYNNFKQFSWVN